MALRSSSARGRRISLTRAGQVLLEECRPLLAAANTVALHVRTVAADAYEVYTIGHTPAISSSEAYLLLEPTIDAFPNISFTFRQMFPDVLRGAVAEALCSWGCAAGSRLSAISRGRSSAITKSASPVTAPLTTGTVAFVTSPPGPAMSGRIAVVDLKPSLLVPVQALWQRHSMSAIRETVLTR